MVIGLDLFIKHFEPYTNHYVLIGGSACDWQMEQKGLPFRATKNIDTILIVEGLSDGFVNHFWQFIKDGEYAIKLERKSNFTDLLNLNMVPIHTINAYYCKIDNNLCIL